MTSLDGIGRTLATRGANSLVRTGQDLLGSLGEGAAALARAHDLARELAAIEHVPLFGARRAAASQLRTDAVANARRGVELLGTTLTTYGSERIARAAEGLARGSIRAAGRARAAADFADLLASSAGAGRSSVVGPVVASRLRETLDATNPRAVLAALRDLAHAPAATVPIDRQVTTAAIAALLDSPAVAATAPALGTAWPAAARTNLLESALFTLPIDGSDHLHQLIARHVLAGAFESDAATLAAARELLAAPTPLDLERTAQLHALLGDLQQTLIGQGADRLGPVSTRLTEPTIAQRSAVEAVRIALLESPTNTARLDDELGAILRRATQQDLATDELARLRAIAFGHGRAAALDLPARVPSGTVATDAIQPWVTRPGTTAAASITDERRLLLDAWHELLAARDLDPSARIARGGELVRAAATSDRDRQLLAILLEAPEGPARLGLGGAFDPAVAVSDSLFRYPESSRSRLQLASWRLDLLEHAGGAAALDVRRDALAARAIDLSPEDLAELTLLAGRRPAAHVSSTLAGVGSAQDALVHLPGSELEARYRRAWQHASNGVDPAAAAARTRRILGFSGLTTAEQDELLTFAVDLGGARELGLPTALAGSPRAGTALQRGGNGDPADVSRYRDAWRAVLDGTTYDPARVQASVDALRAARTPADIARALADVLLEAADVPGAPSALLGDAKGDGVAPLVDLLNARRYPELLVHGDARESIGRAIEQRLLFARTPLSDVRAELARVRSTVRHPSELIAALADSGATARLGIVPAPAVARNVTEHGTAVVDGWRASIDLAIDHATPADLVARLRRGPADDPASLVAAAYALDPATAPTPDAARRLIRFRELSARAGTDTRTIPDRMVRLAARILDTPPADAAAARARVIELLAADWTDPAVLAAARSELVDTGLIAALAPGSTAAAELQTLLDGRAEFVLGPGVPGRTIAAALRLLHELAPSSGTAPLVTRAEQLAIAEPDLLQALLTTFWRDSDPRAFARRLASTQGDGLMVAERIVAGIAALGDDPALAAQLAPVRAEFDALIARNRARFTGALQDTYSSHPDYAEVGRLQAMIGLAARLASDTPAAAGAAALTW